MNACQSRPLSIVLGVCGGIAAYKAAYILRQLTEAGHDVHVVPTPASTQMVGVATWQALSHHPVATGIFENTERVDHIALAQGADLIIIAPATATTIAKIATGMADNLLTAITLAATCPVVLAPAMHTEMWNNPATQANIATLKARGMHICPPATGRLTGSDSGVGRLPEPADIVTFALAAVAEDSAETGASTTGEEPGAETTRSSDTPIAQTSAWRGMHVVITAGGTREAIDPVRYLGNRSSGRQGIALAKAAAARGARVDLIGANIEQHLLDGLPALVRYTAVTSAAELQEAACAQAASADVVIMAAAVADYRPVTRHITKHKKNGDAPLTLELVQNPDVLRGLVRERRPGQIIVGFAAETGDEHHSALELGRQKARRKGADLLAINAVGYERGFGDVPNEVTIVDSTGQTVSQGGGSKADVAAVILDAIAAMRADSQRG